MLTPDDLTTLTDPTTVSRGRAYARSGRVTHLREAPGEVRARVDGSMPYAVRLSGASWSCTCPVGLSGALCKHCVAVVLTLATPGIGDLEHPAASDTTAAATTAATDPPAAAVSITDLTEDVKQTLTPRRRFYEYRHANAYAFEAEALVQDLEDAARNPTVPLLRVLERAVTLTVRTILRSDDSSGAQGDQIRRLLDAHAQATHGLAGDLDRTERRRLAVWLHRFRFSGTQDFFDPDIAAYGTALSPDGTDHYRTLVEDSARTGEDRYAVEYARTRLAVLDRDPTAIVTALGGPPTTQHHALRVVEALDDAGLTRHAVQHAERALHLPRSHRHRDLVARLVQDALARGALDDAHSLRYDHFRSEPGSMTFAALREAAEATGTWEAERATAEQHLAAHRPDEYINHLLHEGRDDEAWQFATEDPGAADAAQAWPRLCARRTVTAPADTLPVYRRLVDAALSTADKRSYHHAAKLLLAMRTAATAADTEDEYLAFVDHTREVNRRRPTFLRILQQHGVTGTPD